MNPDDTDHIYNTVIQKIIDNEEQLPSLPSVTLKIRNALSNPHTEIDEIAKLVRLDPSLSALLLKYAASPLYKRPVPPKTIESVLSMIGLPALNSLVMTHSIKSLFILKDPQLKKLFQLTWERMMYKAAVCVFLAKKLGLRPAEQAMTKSLLTEIGTLVLLSAFSAEVAVPDEKTYIQLCRKHSKRLTVITLSKWGMDKNLVKLSHYTGKWDFKYSEKMTLLDIINIAIYSTVQHQASKNDLPNIQTVHSYSKLPKALKELTEDNKLVLIEEKHAEIDGIIGSIK
ncbi:MAG: HD-like signal output (HDOD) protein [Cellvibrionaceae bacterium]|jgi:HD-like signal output (HDOD) protein